MSLLISTLVLLAEMAVVALMAKVVYDGYFKGRLNNRLLFFALAYETVFNVGYMVFRATNPQDSPAVSHTIRLIGMFHGIFSLVMFPAAIAYFLLAYRGYRSGENFFKKHRITTIIFAAAWAVALASGILLYVLAYF